MTNYKTLLTKSFKKLVKETKLIKNCTKELTKEEDDQLLANKYTLNQIKKAAKLYKTDPMKAAEILCNIPYNLVFPKENYSKKYKIVGSMALYRFTDSMRHYYRMLELQDSHKTAFNKPWHNNLIAL